MTADELTALVRRIVVEVVKEAGSAPADARAVAPVERPAPPLVRRSRKPLPPPRHPGEVDVLRATTPSRILTGRTGTRYLTESYLGLRADHAIALDAVDSEIAEGWAEQQGWLSLRTRAKDHTQFFLHPDEGRRLDDASRAKCEKEADQGCDIQLIAGDGLSAIAIEENGPPLMKALQASLTSAGFRLGKPAFVKFARIGVQDEIGVITRAKATIIMVGERPGLGTGDSVSLYTAYGPKLGQDNAEKDCISNVRQLGFVPERAAAKCTELMKRTFAAGGGGVKLLTAGAFRSHVT